MTIQIDIEDTNLIRRDKKDGSGVYYQQLAYAHIPNMDGSPSRYPVQLKVMPPRDKEGNSQPYQLGKYTVSPTSFKVNNYGQLELAYLSLRNLDPAKVNKSK